MLLRPPMPPLRADPLRPPTKEGSLVLGMGRGRGGSSISGGGGRVGECGE